MCGIFTNFGIKRNNFRDITKVIREDEKLNKMFNSFSELVKEMNAARILIDAIPEDHEFTNEEIDCLDDVRMQSMRLETASKDCLDEFSGKVRGK